MRGHKMHTNEQIEAKSAKHQAAAQHQIIKSSGSQDEMRVFDCGVCSSCKSIGEERPRTDHFANRAKHSLD